ncbi:MAG: glutamine-hydrolyzing carbamoyl-phosphate synthase small subunit [Dehalococcoidia bacterium]
MGKKALLVLEDRSVYEGHSFGADVLAYGEVVFNTSMTGYQEVLTDPSYSGQIVALTYPLIGNYGINPDDVESKRIQVSGFVVREDCRKPSHWQSTSTLHEFLVEAGIPGISGVDTRALTRRLRSAGVMMGIITTEGTPEEALKWLNGMPRYDDVDFVKGVTAETSYQWNPSSGGKEASKHRIVCVDCGLKYNILRILRGMGCDVTVVPCTTSAEEILALKPDGILLSPGPGDPALLGYMDETVRGLMGKKPIMGICLGNQLIGRAFGAKTFKLKFGHRGANHPVRDLDTDRVYITAQNHGYALDADTVKNGLEVSHINLNDETVEGIKHRDLPVFAIQYHSEASPGPRDNVYLFKKFLEMVRG